MADSGKAGWSISFCNIKDIPIRMHAALPVLLLWVAWEMFSRGADPGSELLFVVGVLLSLAFHELGHTLMASLFSIETSTITLLPFGGIAKFRESVSPRAELLIAVSGPFMSMILALLLFPTISDVTAIIVAGELPLAILPRLFVVNAMLALFNLIPALPMDGGRMLRALLSHAGVERSEVLTARFSQLLCLLFILIALYYVNLILVFCLLLALIGATEELFIEQTRSSAERFMVSDVMLDRKYLLTLSHGASVSQATREAIRTGQSCIPILLGEDVVGVIDRNLLLNAGFQVNEELFDDTYISEFVERDYLSVRPDTPLGDILEQMQTGESLPYLVMDESGALLGMLDKSRLVEFLMLMRSRGKSSGAGSGRLTDRADENN